MSIIVPAGNKNIVWSPKEKKAVTLVKTAGVVPGVPDGTGPHGGGEGCQCRGEDPLFDAAKDFADAAGKGDDAVVEVETVGGEKAEQEGKSELKNAVEEVKDAVEKVEVAVEKVEGAEEAEIEVEVDGDDTVEVEVADEFPAKIPGEEVKDGEVIVTSEPKTDACACAKSDKKEVKEAAKDEKKCDECKKTPCECKKDDKKEEVKEAAAEVKKEEVKEAAVEEEFIRFAKLSPVNKRKIADYWKNALGYPKDYVDLMTKDHEK